MFCVRSSGCCDSCKEPGSVRVMLGLRHHRTGEPSHHTHLSIICRRRKKTEEKAKDVASVWGGGREFIKFLATLAALPRTIFNNRMNCIRMI